MRNLRFMRNLLATFITALLLSISAASQAQEIRGLYINNSDEILGDRDQESQLLEYLIQGNFNSITFYSFHNLDFNKPENRENLRRFIRLGKSKYGLTRIGAASESLNGFINNIHLYNLDPLTLPEDRIDHYNLEFEFWSNRATADYYCTKYLKKNGYACNPDGAFSFVCQLLKNLRSQISDFPEIEIEVYIGWIDEDHAAVLTQLADRILYAVYKDMEDDGSIELYNSSQQRNRISSLGQNREISIVPIFSSYDGSTDPSLHNWLRKGHSPCEAWQQYSDSFNKDHFLKNKKNLTLDGYQWFKYSSMPKLPVNLVAPRSITGPTVVSPDQTVRYVIPTVDGALRYEWQIYPQNSQDYRPAINKDMLISFPQVGNATIMVRALGCGSVSPFTRLHILVKEHLPADELVSAKQASGFSIIVKRNNLYVSISTDIKGPFHLQLTDILGRKILTRTLSFPGEYNIPYKPIVDSIKVLQVNIAYQQGSFSKTFSILDL